MAEMSDVIVRDNTADPVTGGITGFSVVSFTFTSSSHAGYGLSEIDLGFAYSGGSNYGRLSGGVEVSLGGVSLGYVYDTQVPEAPGGLYALVQPAPIALAPFTQYTITVAFSFAAQITLEFSSSTDGIGIAGEGYTRSMLARTYGFGPTSPTGSYVARIMEAPATANATAIAPVVCYAAGTQILTAHGEVAIEALCAGNLLFSPRTLSFIPALWIARQRVRDPAHRAVRIAAGALGPNKPHTDLVTSPNHSLFLDGILVPAFALINGATVTWDPRPSIDYHHIECATHDLVLANGTPSETWLDYGNRAAFDNAGTHPTIVPLRHPLIEAPSAGLPDHCVPCHQHGPAVDIIRRALRTHALTMGCTLSVDADLHVVADGRRLDPRWVHPSIAAFHVPADASSLHLVSRTLRMLDLAETADTRVLGVAVGRIWASGRRVGLDTLEGQPGWWHQEVGDAPFRWTNGAAALPPGSRSVRVEVLRQLEYLTAPEPQAIMHATAPAVA